MEHLPYIESPSHRLDKVPCFVTHFDDVQNNLSLLEFPRHKGFALGRQLGEEYDEWSLYPLPSCSLSSDDAQGKSAFIQAWLFFTPLLEIASIVGIPFSVDDFIYEQDGSRFVTTSKLENFFDAWTKCEDVQNDVSLKASRLVQVDELLQTVQAVTTRNLCIRNVYKRRWLLPEIVLTSIQILNEALVHAWSMIYHDGAEHLGHETGGGIWGDLLDQRMQDMGWCLSEISILQQKFSATGRYFASRLRRRKTAGRPHTDCDETKCMASQVKKGEYVTQHTDPKCTCNFISINVDEVRHILRKGEIPRIRIVPSGDTDNLVRLEVEAAGEYVAFSHVWAHGLGNENTNALPNCQLEGLQQMASNLTNTAQGFDHDSSSVLIWIDTLCVPTGSGKDLALKMMRKTYIDATYVLVLDEELCHQPRNSPIEEICIRFVLCAWSRCLWTFEEGFLARNRLFIQFREGATSFTELIHNYKPTKSSPLRYESMAAAQSVLPIRKDSPHVGEDIIKFVTNACKHRTTSRLTDETFVLASTVGLNTAPLLKHKSQHEMMRAFLLQCHQIPADIIFFDGPKLNMTGFKWAPYSFLHPLPTNTILGSDRKGICSADGLTASWPSISLKFPTSIPTDAVELYYFRTTNADEGDDEWFCIASIDSVNNSLHGETPNEDNLAKFRGLPSLTECTLILADDELQFSSAAILSVLPKKKEEQEEEGTRHADFVVNVVANTYPVMSGVFQPDKLDPARCIEIEAGLVAEVEWCVS